MLHLIANKTENKDKIIYVGHSLGTALGLIYASEFPDEAKSLVKLFVLLSPSYKLGNMKSPYKHFRTMFPTFRVTNQHLIFHFHICTLLGDVKKI